MDAAQVGVQRMDKVRGWLGVEEAAGGSNKLFGRENALQHARDVLLDQRGNGGGLGEDDELLEEALQCRRNQHRASSNRRL